MHTRKHWPALAVGFVVTIANSPAFAWSFESEGIRGSFDSTLSAGLGMRVGSHDCRLIVQGASGAEAPVGCLSPTAGIGDQGDLNYKDGDLFTAYLKGSHELLLRLPGEVSMLARANWLRDISATRTTRIISATSTPDFADGLTGPARKDLRFKARLLDLWVSKTFDTGTNTVRVRVGNQVINWGESLFLPGGINSTNALDAMRLSQPGTQLKEAVLPAPMVSVASGMGGGVNIEGYVQAGWNKTYLPPVGSYWSTSHVIGKGSNYYGVPDSDARNGGQWGLAIHWRPPGTQADVGVYALNYHDKLPELLIDQATFTPSWVYPEDRKLFGVSVNFPLGDWAIGTELSYRPKDAVTVSPLAGCTGRGGRCWADEKRLQWHLTGLLSLTPSNAGVLLGALGAGTGSLLAEAVVIRYPNLKQVYDGDPIAAGLWGWGQEIDPSASPKAVGTASSSGINFDLSLTYDGTLLEGWQVIPEIYYYRALSGRTPNLAGQFMKGASSVNFMLSFVQNPADWQLALNYARFAGGHSPFDQPLADRDFVGVVLSRNF